MIIDERSLLGVFVCLQSMATIWAFYRVSVSMARLSDGLARLEPVVIPPRPTGNPTIRIYDSVAYFVEWCQAQDHTGEIEFKTLWQLYQKYCAMRDVSEVDQVGRTMLASRLTHLLGTPKTLSDRSGSKRQRLQVYTIPCPLEFQLEDGAPVVEANNVHNFRRKAA